MGAIKDEAIEPVLKKFKGKLLLTLELHFDLEAEAMTWAEDKVSSYESYLNSKLGDIATTNTDTGILNIQEVAYMSKQWVFEKQIGVVLG